VRNGGLGSGSTKEDLGGPRVTNWSGGSKYAVAKKTVHWLYKPFAILPLEAGKIATKIRLPILDSVIPDLRKRRTYQKATRT